MKYIFIYLIIGILITAIGYGPDPDETFKQLMMDAALSIIAWPIMIIGSIIHRNDEDDDDEGPFN